MDPNDMQKRMQDLQKTDAFSDAFSKIVSGGRSGYKAVIEKKQVIIQCKHCYTVLENHMKFCFECGNKAEKPIPQD